MFTLVPSEYRTRAPVPGGTNCECTLRKKEEKNKILRSTCGKCSFEKTVIESSFNYYIESRHTYTNPRPGQYLTRAHSHITRAVAAMDSCFARIGAHQHGIAAQSMNGENPRAEPSLKGVLALASAGKGL